jgi:hypothetical protein
MRTFLVRRLATLALLSLVVFCQPWWWDVGDLRPHAPAVNKGN